MPDEPLLLLRVCEVAALLRVSRSKVYDMINCGELPALRFGPKTVRVSRVTLERWLESQESIPEPSIIDTGSRWR